MSDYFRINFGLHSDYFWVIFGLCSDYFQIIFQLVLMIKNDLNLVKNNLIKIRNRVRILTNLWLRAQKIQNVKKDVRTSSIIILRKI